MNSNKYDYYYEMKDKRKSYEKDKIDWERIIYITMFYPTWVILFFCILATYLAKIGVIK